MLFLDRLLQAAITLDKAYTPLLCFLGFLGNSLSLAVFCLDSKYRSQSSSYYLSALAVSDTGFLVSLFAVWLEGFVGGVITNPFMCPLVMYLGQVTCFTSVYITVAFSIERYKAVQDPLFKPIICTPSRAKKVIFLLTIGALLLFSYAWRIAKVVELKPEGQKHTTLENRSLQITELKEPIQPFGKETEFSPFAIPTNGANNLTTMPLFGFNTGKIEAEFKIKLFTPVDHEELGNPSKQYRIAEEKLVRVCTVPIYYHKISEVANYLDTMVTLVIPFIVITYFNVRIAVCVWKLKDEREQILALQGGIGNSNIISTERSSRMEGNLQK